MCHEDCHRSCLPDFSVSLTASSYKPAWSNVKSLIQELRHFHHRRPARPSNEHGQPLKRADRPADCWLQSSVNHGAWCHVDMAFFSAYVSCLESSTPWRSPKGSLVTSALQSRESERWPNLAMALKNVWLSSGQEWLRSHTESLFASSTCDATNFVSRHPIASTGRQCHQLSHPFTVVQSERRQAQARPVVVINQNQCVIHPYGLVRKVVVPTANHPSW